MNSKNKIKEKIAEITPFIGVLAFVGLYSYASTLYPGGSQVNLNSEGFDWVNNYWCNLMNDKGMNGRLNPAQPFAIMALIVLCFSLMFFFIQFAHSIPKNSRWKNTIRVSGILSMAFAMLIYTQYHDAMTTMSSIFGLFAAIGIIREVYKSEMTVYKISGVVCILLLGINNYVYYTEQFIQALPLLQKVTLVIVLLWIIGLNYELNKRKHQAGNNPAA